MIEAIDMVSLTTPRGSAVTFAVRPGTNDENVCLALTMGDEYRMRKRQLTGYAIDVGAHIGAWAIPAVLDNPSLHVLAIEAVPENCDLLRENIRHNHVEDRVTVIQAAAARPGDATAVCHWGYTKHDSGDDGYVSAHRFVGNTWADQGEPEFGGEMEAVSLDDLIERYALTSVSLLKIDCEGCEWAFLDSPAISEVTEVIGEYHGGYTGHESYHGGNAAADMVALLSPTHDVTLWNQEPIIGLFNAVRRG